MENVETGNNRDEQGKFIQGVSGNLQGRPPETLEQKIIKKATKEFISEYKTKLSEALPLISPVLIAKALEGDIAAIKEVNDRVMGKPKQTIAGDEDHPLRIITVDKDILEKYAITPSKSEDNS